MRATVRLPSLLLAAWLILSAACSGAAKQGDRFFALGDYANSAAAYEASMGAKGEVAPTARTLYRLAIARGTPGTSAFDPAKAVQTFDDLSKRYPASSYTREAALPASLLKELAASMDRKASLQRDLEQAQAKLEALALSSQEDGQNLRRELEDRKAQVLQLKARVGEQEQALARLKAQMEQLKRIDLGAPAK